MTTAFRTMPLSKDQKRYNLMISIGIAVSAIAIALVPIPGLVKKIVVVSGTELKEPLESLQQKFKQAYPNIDVQLEFQGSQDIANRFVDNKNQDFTPTILIPANGEILKELDTRWRSQNGSDAFYETPRPITKTMLVGIAWSDRGKVLFPNGSFDWNRVEQAMQAGSWAALGGNPSWGSFDFVSTDPIRSNSGQLALVLWAQSKLGSPLTSSSLNNPNITNLFKLAKRSIYQPPSSTDTLLKEFIARGPNDADLGIVYESIALYRWQQSATSQGKPYQIYYLSPTIETVSTAAIARRNVDNNQAEAGRKFVDFLSQPEQQAVFVQFGFRPVSGNLDLKSVPNSPWNQNIPGVEVKPNVQPMESPNTELLSEIKRVWERAN